MGLHATWFRDGPVDVGLYVVSVRNKRGSWRDCLWRRFCVRACLIRFLPDPSGSRRLARFADTLAGFLPTDRYLRRSRTSFGILTSLKETGTILQGTCPPGDHAHTRHTEHGWRIARFY